MQFKEYMALSMTQKEERYDELSEKDKLRLRMSSAIPRTPRCNDCILRSRKIPLVCAAHPDGLTADMIRAAEKECSYFQE